MREDVQVGFAAVEVVDVAEFSIGSARTARASRAIVTQKGAILIVASVGKVNVSKTVSNI
jgi:hypothetical protein